MTISRHSDMCGRFPGADHAETRRAAEILPICGNLRHADEFRRSRRSNHHRDRNETGDEMSDAGTPAVLAAGLVKTFAGDEEVEAVRGVDLGVRTGEIFGFLGPNGAGKSTTV